MTKIILSFIFIGVAGALIFGYVKPTFDSAKKIKTDTLQYDKALSRASEIQTLKRTLLSRFNLFSTDKKSRLRQLLPDHVDNVHLILDIDGIASVRGIRIGSVKVQRAVDTDTDVQIGSSAVGFNSASAAAKPYQTIVLEFSAVATYDEFKAFLQDLERSLRIVDLVDLSISQAGRVGTGSIGGILGEEDIDQPNMYKFDVGIRTYWLK